MVRSAMCAMLRLAVFACLFIAIACGGSDRADETAPTPEASGTAGTAVAGDITVFAAASLADAFEDIKTAFEAENGGVSVTYNFAGSPALRTQLREGADADIYAAADTTNMQQALDAGLVVDAGDVVARNRLVVIVPADNPAGITALQDLASDDLKLVLAAEGVPAGRYARESLARMDAEGSFGENFSARVLDNVVSNEPNVKAVVTKVQLGEADAGIVYATDVTADVEEEIDKIEIPDALNVSVAYPIAITTNASHPGAAAAFIDFVLSEAGQAILAEYGFGPIE